MIKKLHLQFIFWTAVTIYTLFLFADGQTLAYDLLKPASFVLVIVAGIVAIFDNFFWSCSQLYPWFVTTPNLKGTWKGILKTNWVNPISKEAKGPVECFVSIHQTYNNLSFRLMTSQSESNLLTYSFVASAGGVCELTAVYLNRPKFSNRGLNSEIHYGSVLLQINGQKPSLICGHYWTDRNTSGVIELLERTNMPLLSFEDCKNFFEKNRVS